MIFEYYFSIWAYISFGDDYNFCDTEADPPDDPYCENQRCVSLRGCIFTTFDYSFKETGSVGAWLNDPDGNGGEYIDYSRWSYDNLQKLLMMEIMINIVAGIIIDEYTNL